MKKALLYGLALVLALSLSACNRPKEEQPTQPDPAPSTSAPADTSAQEPAATPETVKDTTPEPVENTAPEPEPEQTPAAPVEAEDTQPPEETAPEKQEEPTEQLPEKTPPAAQTTGEGGDTPTSQAQTQGSESSTQYDGHDDLGDYVLNGKGGKYYPALGITLPVSYDGTTTNGAPPQTPEEQEAAKRAHEEANESSKYHTESWAGVSMGG